MLHIRRLAACLQPHRLLLALCCLLVFLIRAQSFPHNVDNFDESIFWVMAQDIANGGIPYVTTWDHKGPFLYYLLAIPAYFFPSSVVAQEAFVALCVIVNMLFLFLIASVYVPRLYAVAGAFAYGLFVSAWWPGLTANAEHFVTLAQLPAIYLLTLWRERAPRRRYLYLAGVCMAAIALNKLNLVLAMAPALPLLYRGNMKEFLENGTRVFLGFLAPVALMCGYFWHLGNLDDFYLGYIVFNHGYGEMFPREMLDRTYWLFGKGQQGAATVLALFMAAALFFRRKTVALAQRRYLNASLLGIVGVAFAIAYPAQGLDYYFLSMVPNLCLLVPLFLAQAAPLPDNQQPAFSKMLALFFAAVCAVTAPFSQMIYDKGAVRLEKTPKMQAALHIAAHTKPDDRIFAYYGDAMVYFLADRIAPGKTFLWMHNTVDYRNLLIQDLGIEDMVAALYANPPAYIVYTHEKKAGRFGPVPPAYRRFLEEYYVVEAVYGYIDLYRHKHFRASAPAAPAPADEDD